MTTTRSSDMRLKNTKVMRFGYELFSPILRPPGGVPAAPRCTTGINPLNTISFKENSCMDEWQKQAEQQARNDNVFTIGANGCIEIVRSPYSNLTGDAYLTLCKVNSGGLNPINLFKGISFHDVLPSSTISQSEIIFDENPLGFLMSNSNSFSESYTTSGNTDTSAAVNICKTAIEKKKPNESSFLNRYDTMFEDEVMPETDISRDEEIGFSVERPQVLEMNKSSIKAKDENREKKARKNYSPNTTNFLMDWFFQHDGRVPNNQIKKDLAMETGKSVIQISTWFQNARRRYMQTLKSYQELSKKYPTLVYNNQSFKAYVKSHK